VSTDRRIGGIPQDQVIGQLFMVGFHGTAPTPRIVELIRRQHVGGVILFLRNVRDAEQVLRLTGELQAVARDAGHPYPLLVAIDQENGIVQRLGTAVTPLPGNMALGAIDSEEVAERIAEATGRELRALGINMNLAPVADVNSNPANPVIGVRSFGEDPERVARLTAAAVRGYRRAGVIATLKHFPGHGDTAVDSHVGIPVVPRDLAQLRQVELVPFREGIAAGAPAVLTAHVALPALTGDDGTPATLAPEVVHGLLRGELGFGGVAVTDCLEMGAIARAVGTPRGAVAALGAGNDLVLVSHTHALQRQSLAAVGEALERGELGPTTLAAAAARVVRLKSGALAWDALPTPAGLAAAGSAADRALSEEAYARAITVVRDDDELLPLRLDPGRRLAIVATETERVSQAVDLAYAPEDLADRVRRYHAQTVAVVLPRRPDAAGLALARGLVAESDLALLVTLNAHLDGEQVGLLRRVVAGARAVVGLAVGDPYDAGVFSEVGTYLAAYEYTAPALRAAVRVLFGAARATGRLPVTV
jgi:beta-N-acetylhexosaminidase